MTTYYKLLESGMGGFLNPPGHPEHTSSVGEFRSGHEVGSMNLSYALEAPDVPAATKTAVRTMLNSWERSKPPLDTPEIQDWIRQVLGYFRGMYQIQEGDWGASSLMSRPDLDPIRNAERHAGVHFIQEYYPEFKPTRKMFREAYWGRKPVKISRYKPTFKRGSRAGKGSISGLGGTR